MPLYTVSQVTRYLRDALDRDAILRDLWVTGEVSSFTRSALGHMYFTLREADSQIRCVMFRNGVGGEVLAGGVAIAAHGRVSFYETRGELQLYVDMVRPQGLGEMHLELERLKVRLEAEGLFDQARKRPIPPFPQRIAVITSPTGAVWHDIQNVVRRRYPLVELALVPCSVQGENAVPSILEAFAVLRDELDVDAVIVARGGGSPEELMSFNDEAVARAIYASPHPVISAVGHETDVTVADLVADLRAPTPSAAAELAVPDATALREAALQQVLVMTDSTLDYTRARQTEIQALVQRVVSRAPDTAGRRQRIDDALHVATLRLSATAALHRERLRSITARLGALDPHGVLGRGYAVVQREETGETVASVHDVAPHDALRVHVRDGSFPAEVSPLPLREDRSDSTPS